MDAKRLSVYVAFVWAVTLANSREYKVGNLIIEKCCFDSFAFETSASAINIALDKLKEDGVLQNNDNISFISKVADQPSVSAGAVVDMVLNKQVDAIFGSPASRISIPVGHLTTFWNIPQISWASTSPELTDKSTFKTYIRTLGPFTKIGIAFVGLFNRFDWKLAGLYMDSTNEICNYATQGIIARFRENNITVAQYFQFIKTVSTADIDRTLRLLKKSARLIITCSPEKLRDIMITACRAEMCNGDYLFMMPAALAVDSFETDLLWRAGNSDDDEAKNAFRYLLYITIARWPNEEIKKDVLTFQKNVPLRMLQQPWNNSFALDNRYLGSKYAPYLYDATYLYGLWINHTVTHNISVRDGRKMFEFAANTTFMGVSGPVHFDKNADREPFYWFWHFSHPEGYPRIAALANTMSKGAEVIETTIWEGFTWHTTTGMPPKDIPICGFEGEYCPQQRQESNNLVISLCTCMVIMTILVMVIIYIIRRRQLEETLIRMKWKIDIADVELKRSKQTFGSRMSNSSISVGLNSNHSGAILNTVKAGLYKGQTVALRTVSKRYTTLPRSSLIGLNAMRDMSHDNVNKFIGACETPTEFCVLFGYCSKGSLQDILENDEIQLDWLFRHSLMMDLVNGMAYIHSSKLVSHGRLKSTNCLVDNRWMLKITDYGLGYLTANIDSPEIEENERFKALLWTAPELLRLEKWPPNGTQSGDVYSFGIILHEIVYRMGVFPREHMIARDIIVQVKIGETMPCRPDTCIEIQDINPASIRLMELCWMENPNDRPPFSTIKTFMKSKFQDVDRNIVDVMIKRLEKYANNLEELVEHRTQELLKEKKKTDTLLYRMLPPSVADKLKCGEAVLPTLYESVTVYFSDIVGFTTIAGMSTPFQVVSLLNDLYSLFDNIIDQFDAYKVETIGDAYLVVSGLPNTNGDLHIKEICDMSLEIISNIMGFKIKHMEERKLMVRIGIHTGPCCAGVVGHTMPRYCLFGDTVNTASRMESNGESQRIHLSEKAHLALVQCGGYKTEYRGEISIKIPYLAILVILPTFWFSRSYI
ncbi:hypothetical protein ACJMK2_013083 [Sinanodonta woodiana]|uniref:Guanylate cyclase n=1 Tax=Sinanodonta woodiana TaxID=1069815 RepID=A0ABD3VAE3_SINWO